MYTWVCPCYNLWTDDFKSPRTKKFYWKISLLESLNCSQCEFNGLNLFWSLNPCHKEGLEGSAQQSSGPWTAWPWRAVRQGPHGSEGGSIALICHHADHHDILRYRPQHWVHWIISKILFMLPHLCIVINREGFVGLLLCIGLSLTLFSPPARYRLSACQFACFFCAKKNFAFPFFGDFAVSIL